MIRTNLLLFDMGFPCNLTLSLTNVSYDQDCISVKFPGADHKWKRRGWPSGTCDIMLIIFFTLRIISKRQKLFRQQYLPAPLPPSPHWLQAWMWWRTHCFITSVVAVRSSGPNFFQSSKIAALDNWNSHRLSTKEPQFWGQRVVCIFANLPPPPAPIPPNSSFHSSIGKQSKSYQIIAWSFWEFAPLLFKMTSSSMREPIWN